MKRIVFLSLAVFSGLASAQSVDWNRAWSGCSAETREFDAEAPGSGTNSQKVKEWVENNTGSPSTNVAGLQRKLEEDRALLSDRNRALLVRLSAKLAICGSTAALKQLQNGSTQTTQRSPTPAPASQNEPEEDSLQCVRGISSESVLVNRCRKGVNLVWCAVPRSGQTPNVNCELQQFSPANLSPGDRVTVEDNFQIAWTMCDAPKRVVNVRYFSGRGVEGTCRR